MLLYPECYLVLIDLVLLFACVLTVHAKLFDAGPRSYGWMDLLCSVLF